MSRGHFSHWVPRLVIPAVLLSHLSGYMPAVGKVAGLDQDVLTGIWNVTLRVQRGGLSSRPGEELRGQIALLRASDLHRGSWANLSHPTHLGVYNLDLEALRVSRWQGGGATVVIASVDNESRVNVVINPHSDHGSLVIQGTAVGDSITGSWYVTAYAGGATGTFTMRKTVR